MTGNDWYDRTANGATGCVGDTGVAPVAFGGLRGRERHGPKNLRVPTLADEMRRQLPIPPRVVSVAKKPRSAIGLGGHAGTVVWVEDLGVIATSDAYTPAPWPDVERFARDRRPARDYGETWTRRLPLAAYRFEDASPFESTPGGWTREFPHRLVSPTRSADRAFVEQWERSPWNDRLVTDLALHLLRSRRLGRGPGTDFLGLSLSSLDHTGHAFGPESHEVQDILIHVDIAVGRLLQALDRDVGPGRYTLALTADHGVSQIPERLAAAGQDAGRISSTDLRKIVDDLATTLVGEGPHTMLYSGNQLHFTAASIDRLRKTPGAFDGVRAAIEAIPGVARVYDAAELASSEPTTDGFLAAWRLSYVPGRSGDFVVLPRANWIVSSDRATHGTPYDYDRRVPLVLFGAAVRPGRYSEPASPADIAPTLARLAGVRLPAAEGRVLAEALDARER
jgi:hypothetical protein